MANICLYLNLNITKRLRAFNIVDMGGTASYFDEQLIHNEVRSFVNQGFPLLAQYLANLSSQQNNAAVCGLLFSGGLLEAVEAIKPTGWQPMADLLANRQASLIAQPYYHSLNFLIDRERLQQEVEIMQEKIIALQGKPATTFFHTDLLYNDYLGYWANNQGFALTFAPKTPGQFDQRSMYQLFHPPHSPEVGLLVPDQELADRIESADMPEEELYQHLAGMCQEHGLITLGFNLEKLLLAPHKMKKLFGCLLKLQQEGLAHILSPEALADWEKTGGALSIPAFHSIHEKEDTLPWLENPLQKEAWLALYSHPKTIQEHPFLQNALYFLQMGQSGEGKQHLRVYRQYRSMLADINLKYSNKSS